MKKLHRLHFVFCVGLCLWAQTTVAETILKRSYGFDKLDAFWTSTLEQPAPSAQWFAPLAAPRMVLSP